MPPLPGPPSFGLTIEEPGARDEDVASWVDIRAALTSAFFDTLWDVPTAQGVARAARIVTGIRAGVVNPAEGLTGRVLDRPLNCLEEITMLCSSLEAMVGGRFRDWNIRRTLAAPEALAAYPFVLQELKRTHPGMTDAEIRALAPPMMTARRSMLLWALLAVVYARDRLQHGQAYPVTFVSDRAWKHVKLLQGLVILPSAQVYALKLLDPVPDPNTNPPQQAFLARGLDALQKLGETYTESELHGHLQVFVQRPRCFMECIAITPHGVRHRVLRRQQRRTHRGPPPHHAATRLGLRTRPLGLLEHPARRHCEGL